MIDVMSPPLTHVAAPPDSTPQKNLRQRDEIFWTELEIRRLGNLVAECIHARRYIGETEAAHEERVLMRKYIDAMKRKAMRVLHRAELYAKSGYAAWPGIDSSITEPVSLAEEYVGVVENYEAVVMEEEGRVKRVMRELGGEIGEIGGDRLNIGNEEEWEVEDEVAYREAVKREVAMTRNAENARDELLGDGVRRRKTGVDASETAGYSKEDEELMKKHQPVQDELTSNLVDLVGQLKQSITVNKEKLEKDVALIDQTEDALDRNLVGVDKQRTQLKKYSQSTAMSWWVIMIAAIVIVVVFVTVFILLKIPL